MPRSLSCRGRWWEVGTVLEGWLDLLSGALHKAEHLLVIQTLLFSGESGLGEECLLPIHEQKAEQYTPSASLNSALFYLAQNL